MSLLFSKLRPLRTALVIYGVLHLLLFAFDLGDPGAFLRGDRGDSRLDLVLRALHDPGEWRALFLETGLPGDYLVFVPFYGIGGSYAVILAQILAGAVTLLAAFGLARALGATERVAAVAAIFFAVMPGSLMDPHLLVTETFFTALFSCAVWALASSARIASPRRLWIGMVLMTLAAGIRPQAIPFALIAAIPLLWVAPLRPHAILSPVAMLFIFPGTWLLWRWLAVGEFGLGPSMFDIGINLRIRADRMALVVGIPDWVQMDLFHPERTTLAQFVALSEQYPGALMKTLISDFINLVANPGANGLFGKYLGFFATSSDSFYWKHLLDSQGVLGAVSAMILSGWRLVLSFLLTGSVHLVTMIGALFGILSSLRDRSSRLPAVVTLLIFLAQAGVVFVSGIVRWPHRAPLEPLLAAFAAIGLAWVLNRWRTRRDSSGVLDSVSPDRQGPTARAKRFSNPCKASDGHDVTSGRLIT